MYSLRYDTQATLRVLTAVAASDSSLIGILAVSTVRELLKFLRKGL